MAFEKVDQLVDVMDVSMVDMLAVLKAAQRVDKLDKMMVDLLVVLTVSSLAAPKVVLMVVLLAD